MFDEKEMEKKLQIAVSVYQDLKTQWDRKPPNFQECAKLLDQLKVVFIIFNLLCHVFFVRNSINLCPTCRMLTLFFISYHICIYMYIYTYIYMYI